MNCILDLHVPLWSKEINMKFGEIRLGWCEIMLDWSNNEKFDYDYLFYLFT